MKTENKRVSLGIPKFSIGGYTDNNLNSGMTIISCDRPNVTGIYQTGGSPATRETDVLRSNHRMDYSVDDLVFTGRSVYGFNNLPIIMRWESEHNHGVKIGDAIVPIIPSAAIYDFHDGIKIPKDDWAQRAIDALGGELPLGKEWCGTGATVGKIKGMQYAKPSGQGYSLISKGELKVGVYVVANSLGEVFDLNGNCLSTLNINLESLFNSVIHEDNIINIDSERSLNTTVGTAITNAALTHQQASYIAEAANFGLASRIYPYSTGFDGDTVFAVSTNEVQYPVDEVAYLARIAAEQAIMSIFK